MKSVKEVMNEAKAAVCVGDECKIGDVVCYKEIVEYGERSTKAEIREGTILDVSVGNHRVLVDNPSLEDSRGTWVPLRAIIGRRPNETTKI